MAGSDGGGAGGVLDPDGLPAAQRERWRRLVDAAAELLGADDYEAVQIRDVAARAGMALGTVYRYFPSKQLLYAVVLREWSAADDAERTGEGDDGGGAAERLRERLHHSVRRFEAYPTYLRLHGTLQQSADPAVRAVLDEFTRQVVASYRSRLAGVPQPVRDDVVTFASALLVHQLGLFGQGRQSVGEVHRLIDSFIDVVFGPGVAG